MASEIRKSSTELNMYKLMCSRIEKEKKRFVHTYGL